MKIKKIIVSALMALIVGGVICASDAGAGAGSAAGVVAEADTVLLKYYGYSGGEPLVLTQEILGLTGSFIFPLNAHAFYGMKTHSLRTEEDVVAAGGYVTSRGNIELELTSTGGLSYARNDLQAYLSGTAIVSFTDRQKPLLIQLLKELEANGFDLADISCLFELRVRSSFWGGPTKPCLVMQTTDHKIRILGQPELVHCFSMYATETSFWILDQKAIHELSSCH